MRQGGSSRQRRGCTWHQHLAASQGRARSACVLAACQRACRRPARRQRKGCGDTAPPGSNVLLTFSSPSAAWSRHETAGRSEFSSGCAAHMHTHNEHGDTSGMGVPRLHIAVQPRGSIRWRLADRVCKEARIWSRGVCAMLAPAGEAAACEAHHPEPGLSAHLCGLANPGASLHCRH